MAGVMSTYVNLGSFEESHIEDLPQNAWLVRPCEVYSDEYSDCKSFKARFHQYFIHGETTDCSQWKKDHENCMDWRKNRNADSLKSVIQSEETRIRNRKLASLQNDVWQLRNEPPSDWNSPLPEYLIKNENTSFLVKKQKELDSKTSNEDTKETSFCTIS
uniref:Synaptic plasticity regulator PANTS n=1 Tax=Strigamia maritima TaxID=126957 RepID=T1JLU5_STRMM